MNIKTFIATAVIALTAACTDAPVTEQTTVELPDNGTAVLDEEALDASAPLGENERPK